MTDERFERNLADAARGYNTPPAAPRERMWNRLQAARAERRPASPEPRRQLRKVFWPAAVAAALIAGLGLGRLVWTTAPDLSPAPAAVQIDTAAYRLAAMPVLGRAETLLLQVQAGVDTGRDAGSFGARATDLLGRTRLLLASPAAEDPELGPLLADLELALARLVRLAAGPTPVAGPNTQRQTLNDGLARKSVLPRLRDQLVAGRTVGL